MQVKVIFKIRKIYTAFGLFFKLEMDIVEDTSILARVVIEKLSFFDPVGYNFKGGYGPSLLVN